MLYKSMVLWQAKSTISTCKPVCFEVDAAADSCVSKNLVINYPCGSTLRIASHEAVQLKDSAAKNSNLRKPTPIESVVEIPDNVSTSLALPAQNLCLYSKLSKKGEPIRAIFRPTVRENFIARRIVDRLEFTLYSDPLVVKTVVWDGKRISSTSKFVDLACAGETDGTKDCAAHRFYVVRNCPFDLLFGSSSITPLQTRATLPC